MTLTFSSLSESDAILFRQRDMNEKFYCSYLQYVLSTTEQLALRAFP
jgi:hypothetical protein